MTGPGAVVHLTDPQRADAVLRNVANLRAAVDAAAVIELVVHGAAITVARADAAQAPGVARLIGDGVRVVACRNSMVSQGIGADQLTPGVAVVPAGVAHLVERQWQGFAYVRP